MSGGEPSKGAMEAAREVCPYDHDHGTVECGNCRRVARSHDAFAAEAVRRERSEHHAVGLACCLDDVNHAAAYVAIELHKIANGKPHPGVFGGAEIEAAAQAIVALRESHAELLADRDWHKAALVRIAKGVGVSCPEELTMLAENNEQDYVDLLIVWIKREIARAKALQP